MSVDNISKVAVAIAQDFVPGINTLTVMKEILIDKVNDTSNLFREILVDCERSITDLDDREKSAFYEECYLIYQYTIQGKAKHNIKLLIQYLKGQVNSRSLYIDDFHKYMDVFANLTKVEIEVLAEHFNEEKVIIAGGDYKHLSNNYPEELSDDRFSKMPYMSEMYSLQGKGLLLVFKTTPDGFTKGKYNSSFQLGSIRTSLFDDMFKNINLDLEDIL